MSVDRDLKITRPSNERMPFDTSGRLKPEGPGPLPEGFLDAPDIEGFPWTRKRGDEWTTPEFRAGVFAWIATFFADRNWPIAWDVTEKATADRSAVRLQEDKLYLVIGVQRKSDGERFEVSVIFRADQREYNAVAMAEVLAHAAASLDEQNERV
jgi:hypothetical protein